MSMLEVPIYTDSDPNDPLMFCAWASCDGMCKREADCFALAYGCRKYGSLVRTGSLEDVPLIQSRLKPYRGV